MKIASISSTRFTAPFHGTVRHASAHRDRAQSILVTLRTAAGHIGLGEGCPRAYVTGESLESCERFIAPAAKDLQGRVIDLETLKRWIAEHSAAIDANPAAFCALELAMLDALARERAVSLEALLGLPPIAGVAVYSAVLGDNSHQTFERQLGRYWSLGFRDFKIKLSGDLSRDRRKLDRLRNGAGGEGYRLRLDANNLWRCADRAIAFLTALGYPVIAIEEPLAAGDLSGYAAVAEALGCAIVLDESALVVDDLARAPGPGGRWVVNCRVSKQGGLIRSLRVVQAARDRGMRVIVGAHVGETSILTRAALALGTSVAGGPMAREGAFSTHLLTADPVVPALCFGAGGLLRFGNGGWPGPHGLGLRQEAAMPGAATRWCRLPSVA